MEYFVIVRAEPPDQYVAHALGIPEIQAVATTETEAVDQVRQGLAHWLESAKLVRVEVPVPNGGNPWLDTFGRSADDPEFDVYREEIERARSADVFE
jgi:predicted RNase H-like HicB family nuclease